MTRWVCLGTRRKNQPSYISTGNTDQREKAKKMLHLTLGAIWLTLIVKFLSFHTDLVKTHSVSSCAEHTTLSADFIISFIIIWGWNINKSRNPLVGCEICQIVPFFATCACKNTDTPTEQHIISERTRAHEIEDRHDRMCKLSLMRTNKQRDNTVLGSAM